ncbi:DEAD/DEAH box helicase [uncultured Olegusella sp.]|uniref:DEAD/DEAH box helicase n=1 Tax=uncultured Olegusella sp. TaxID=1979846 RepID=UPI0026372317|nr:DEAD/DEAH box helicase [uncultured Olegusella sp.]
MEAFERYAPFIQDFIYRNGWQSLRGVQVAAAHAIFDTDDNVLLCASTASGKTEAAFFPILSILEEEPSSSVGVLYVGPLKALINDQFGRLEELCEEEEIPVWRWHGDVAASRKAKLIKHPSGILQITPESLEALLLHRYSAIPKLFGDLRFIVIDEVHSLMRGDRGAQTLCVIERLSRLAGVRPRRIGLSATVGDPERTGEYLSAGTGRKTLILRIDDASQRWRLSMEHFYISDYQAVDDELGRGPYVHRHEAEEAAVLTDIEVDGDTLGKEGLACMPQRSYEGKTDTAPQLADPGLGYIFEHSRGRKCLVFANSREDAEAVTTTLRSYCEANGEPDRFLIHHGNLSAPLRESAEDAMKDEETALTTITTSTLELGIDIGRLERAFQIDAPFTVSSFLQRMGRTGRRGTPSEMWFVMREERPEPRSTLGETIPWKLLQGIALVQLYLEERWVEPPRLDRLPFSLLYHQTMATLASQGEMSPAELAVRVLTLTPFQRVTTDDYRVLLHHLITSEQIQQTDEGGLIVGLAGERVVNNFRFYGVFVESEEYTVRSESQELGTTVMPPPVGDKIAIAGATWLVEEVDHKRHVVYCTQVKGQVPAYFGECPGDIHTHILERMAHILAEDVAYPYLMDNARARLAQARRTAGASGMLNAPLINIGGDSWALFPWLGSYAFLALERFLKLRCSEELGLKGLDSSRPYFLQFRMKADAQTFVDVLAKQALRPLDPLELLYPKEVPVFEKYDAYVPVELVRKGFAYGILDTEGMLHRVRQWCGFPELPELGQA